MIDYSALNASNAGTSGNTMPTPKNLGQADFMKLMVAQLQAQDPLKPQDGTAMVSQMAQFSSVSSLDQLQKSFNGFASTFNQNQSLQASVLVGKEVSVKGDKGYLSVGGSFKGEVIVPPNIQSLKVTIKDGSGNPVKTYDLGQQESGNLPFAWDGLKSDGSTAPPGAYSIAAEASIDGKNTQLGTNVIAPVRSVMLNGAQGVDLELDGIGKTPLSSINSVTN